MNADQKMQIETLTHRDWRKITSELGIGNFVSYSYDSTGKSERSDQFINVTVRSSKTGHNVTYSIDDHGLINIITRGSYPALLKPSLKDMVLKFTDTKTGEPLYAGFNKTFLKATSEILGPKYQAKEIKYYRKKFDEANTQAIIYNQKYEQATAELANKTGNASYLFQSVVHNYKREAEQTAILAKYYREALQALENTSADQSEK